MMPLHPPVHTPMPRRGLAHVGQIDMQERWAGTWGSNLHDLRIQGKLLTGFEEF